MPTRAFPRRPANAILPVMFSGNASIRASSPRTSPTTAERALANAATGVASTERAKKATSPATTAKASAATEPAAQTVSWRILD